MASAKRAFTLVELLVVLGIIIVLIAIGLPVALSVHASAEKSQCQSNLRQVLHAFVMYANDNGSQVPRDFGLEIADREPGWQVSISPYAGKRISRQAEAKTVGVYRCPSHPLAELMPSSFVVNAVAFESQPNWYPAGYTKISQIRNQVKLVWLADIADSLGEDPAKTDFVLFPEYHDLWSPYTFGVRVPLDRHGKGSNLGFLDGHVEFREGSKIKFEEFDDGIRDRR